MVVVCYYLMIDNELQYNAATISKLFMERRIRDCEWELCELQIVNENLLKSVDLIYGQGSTREKKLGHEMHSS